MKRYMLIWLAVLGIAVTLHGAFPAPEKLQELIGSATAEKYPNADTVTVYDGSHVVYQRDGLAEVTEEFCIKVMTEAGRDILRNLKFGFDSDYGTRTVLQAAVIKPDGKRIPVDLKKYSSVAISAQSMGSNIFTPTRKVLSVDFPELEIGDAVAATLMTKSIRTPFPGIYSEEFMLQDDYPLLLAEVTVDAPETLPLRSIAVKDKAEDTVERHPDERKNGRIVYRWTARNVPQVLPEPNMPPIRGVAQRLLVSTAQNWQELSRWYCDLCRPRLDAVDDALKVEVKKLTAGAKNDTEKAMALFQFVSQKIRYTGLNNEDKAPGFEPHDVRDTFHQRHGVCRDKAGLLTAMMEQAGLKAYMTLFYAGKPPVDAEVPASRFNHAIVAWEVEPGKYQLMDPTFETTSEFFPAWMANQSYLVARPEGETLRRSPSPDPSYNALNIRTDGAIDPQGKLRATSVIDFGGVNDQMYRSAFSRRSPDAMRQLFARKLQQALPGAKIDKFKVSPEDVRDMSKPLQIVMDYLVPEALDFVAGTEVMPLPELSRVFGIAGYMLADIDLDTRKHPLLFDTTAVTRESFTLTLPDSVQLLPLPEAAKGSAPGIEWKRELEFNDGIVRGNAELTVAQMEIAPRDYPQLKQAWREYTAAASLLPLYRPHYAAVPVGKLAETFPDADSFLERDRTAIELGAGGISIISEQRRYILNYAGVKKNSEIKIAYFPAFEDVEIHAKVTAPDGNSRELKPKEIVNMDAPWVAGAPRYPGERIKVAVLPGVCAGSVIDSTVIRTTQRIGFFSREFIFGDRVPTAKSEFEMHFPRRSGLRLAPPPAGSDFTTADQGDFRVCKWRMTDLPAIPSESMQAPASLFVPTVRASDGDYPTYAKQLDEALRKAAAAPAPSADLLIAKLRAPGDDPKQLALKIRDAVAKKLRAAGPAFSRLPLDRLTPPEQTLSDGYGNSADRATVIAALLNRAGIEYRFRAVSDLPFLPQNTRRLKELPLNIFSGILVYIPSLDLHLNDTDQYAVPGSTAHAAMIGLELPGGSLVAIRPQHKADDETVTEFDIRISADGAAELAVTRHFFGMLCGSEKRRFAEMTPEERRQHFEQLVCALSPAARLTDAGESDFSAYPGTIRFRCRIDKFALPMGEKMQFELPGYVSAHTLGPVNCDRRTPAMRSRAVRRKLKYRIEFPNGFRVVKGRPPFTELGRRNSGYYIEHYSVTRDRIELDTQIVLPVEFIAACDYVELVDLESALLRPGARRILLSGGKAKKER